MFSSHLRFSTLPNIFKIKKNLLLFWIFYAEIGLVDDGSGEEIQRQDLLVPIPSSVFGNVSFNFFFLAVCVSLGLMNLFLLLFLTIWILLPSSVLLDLVYCISFLFSFHSFCSSFDIGS